MLLRLWISTPLWILPSLLIPIFDHQFHRLSATQPLPTHVIWRGIWYLVLKSLLSPICRSCNGTFGLRGLTCSCFWKLTALEKCVNCVRHSFQSVNNFGLWEEVVYVDISKQGADMRWRWIMWWACYRRRASIRYEFCFQIQSSSKLLTPKIDPNATFSKMQNMYINFEWIHWLWVLIFIYATL